MLARSSNPLVYEINTRCWLSSLSESFGRTLTLAEVPEGQLEFWRDLGFTHIWLMGVWRTGACSRQHSLQLRELREAGLGCTEDEIGGSPYAIEAYEVAPELGGDAALGKFREQLQSYRLKLILDFIPNHLGHDHAWLVERPELFVRSQVGGVGTFFHDTKGGSVQFACGKDPFIGAWSDTVQLDYRNLATRVAMTNELVRVARMCDGVRCDMAMLVLNEVFAETWKDHPSVFRKPETEFWSEAIAAVRVEIPNFLFVAEVYWEMETRLQELGFDFTYDKRLYDYLVGKDAAAVQRHVLSASTRFVEQGVHFIENHDERRVASLLSSEEQRAAALVILGLPGMCLLHEGQLTGARHRLSVHLRRRRIEPEQAEVAEFYWEMLAAIQLTQVGRGKAALLHPREAWEGNPTASNFVLVRWQGASVLALGCDLVVVNLASHPSQCYVDLQTEMRGHNWQMKNLLGTESFVRNGDELAQRGLFLDVPAYGAQLFQFTPRPAGRYSE